jgi:agmatine deiminase
LNEIENGLRDYLGVQHFIWLPGAPADFCESVGDDTDYHVDGKARFVGENTVLYTWTEDQSNPHYKYLKQHKNKLENAVTESGKELNLVPLPVPEKPFYSMLDTGVRPPFRLKRAVCDYTNFYIANQVVLVPVYGDVNDPTAKSIIAEHFPDRDIIGIPAFFTSELGGMMHCVTQQQPAVKKVGD